MPKIPGQQKKRVLFCVDVASDSLRQGEMKQNIILACYVRSSQKYEPQKIQCSIMFPHIHLQLYCHCPQKKYLFNFGSFLNIAGPDLAVPKISPLLGLISINLGPLVLLLTKHTSKPIPKISAMYVDLNVDIPGKSTEIISKSKTSTPLSFVAPVAPSASESPPVDVLHSVPPSWCPRRGWLTRQRRVTPECGVACEYRPGGVVSSYTHQ